MKRLFVIILSAIIIVGCGGNGVLEETEYNRPGISTDEDTAEPFILSSYELFFLSEGGTQSIEIALDTPDREWSIDNIKEYSWCTIYIENSTIYFQTSINFKYDDRIAEYCISSNGITKVVRLTQHPKDVLFVGTKYHIGAMGGELEISLDTNVEYDIVVPESDKEWVYYNSTRSMHSDTIVLNVNKNITPYNRSTTIELHSSNGELLNSFQVIQKRDNNIPIPNNEIRYISKSEIIVTAQKSYISDGVNILSNTYESEEGIILCDSPITCIERGVFGDNDFVNITLPNSVTKIGEYAFYLYTDLENIDMPSNLVEIGEYAFYMCHNLKTIKIPENVTVIGGYAFQYCSSLVNVTLNNSIVTIEPYTFNFCSKLKEIRIPDSVEYIKSCAFSGCTELASVIIGNSVKELGAAVFRKCNSIVSVDIPNSVTSIGTDAFQECEKLTKVSMSNNVTYIGANAFVYCTNLSDITISKGITAILDMTFSKCISLKSINIPDRVTEIGRMAFSWCDNLQTIEVGKSLVSIDEMAFTECVNLEEITLPESLTTIGRYAFYKCEKLQRIYCSPLFTKYIQ